MFDNEQTAKSRMVVRKKIRNKIKQNITKTIKLYFTSKVVFCLTCAAIKVNSNLGVEIKFLSELKRWH